MSLYTLGTMLEDPFDTGAAAAPDTLSLTEFMHTLAYVSTIWGSWGLWVAQLGAVYCSSSLTAIQSGICGLFGCMPCKHLTHSASLSSCTHWLT
jgi:hypothetical protein